MRIRSAVAVFALVSSTLLTGHQASATPVHYLVTIRHFMFNCCPGGTLSVSGDLASAKGYCRKYHYLELKKFDVNGKPTIFVASGSTDVYGHFSFGGPSGPGKHQLKAVRDASDNHRIICDPAKKNFTVPV